MTLAWSDSEDRFSHTDAHFIDENILPGWCTLGSVELTLMKVGWLPVPV